MLFLFVFFFVFFVCFFLLFFFWGGGGLLFFCFLFFFCLFFFLSFFFLFCFFFVFFFCFFVFCCCCFCCFVFFCCCFLFFLFVFFCLFFFVFFFRKYCVLFYAERVLIFLCPHTKKKKKTDKMAFYNLPFAGYFKPDFPRNIDKMFQNVVVCWLPWPSTSSIKQMTNKCCFKLSWKFNIKILYDNWVGVFPTRLLMCTAKTQISLRRCTGWSESLLFAWRDFGS